MYEIGRNYLIRTVTMIFTGKLEEVGDKELVITDAAWIAEAERWGESVATGTFREVEVYPDGARVLVGRGAIVDAVAVDWPLPRKSI